LYNNATISLSSRLSFREQRGNVEKPHRVKAQVENQSKSKDEFGKKDGGDINLFKEVR